MRRLFKEIILEDIDSLIKDYIKNNLTVSVSTEKYYGDYGGRDGFKVTISIELDGETISTSSDYSTL